MEKVFIWSLTILFASDCYFSSTISCQKLEDGVAKVLKNDEVPGEKQSLPGYEGKTKLISKLIVQAGNVPCREVKILEGQGPPKFIPEEKDGTVNNVFLFDKVTQEPRTPLYYPNIDEIRQRLLRLNIRRPDSILPKIYQRLTEIKSKPERVIEYVPVRFVPNSGSPLFLPETNKSYVFFPPLLNNEKNEAAKENQLLFFKVNGEKMMNPVDETNAQKLPNIDIQDIKQKRGDLTRFVESKKLPPSSEAIKKNDNVSSFLTSGNVDKMVEKLETPPLMSNTYVFTRPLKGKVPYIKVNLSFCDNTHDQKKEKRSILPTQRMGSRKEKKAVNVKFEMGLSMNGSQPAVCSDPNISITSGDNHNAGMDFKVFCNNQSYVLTSTVASRK